MKNVLVLGAGLVSRPLVRYLLEQPDYHVTMASRTVSKAETIIDGHPNGQALALNVNNDKDVENLVKQADVVVSLLPYTYHVKVGRFCLTHTKHLVTTSYVSDEMHALDAEAKQQGVLFLNECGLDPGIDHMSAMRIIHDVQEKGGKVISFRSTTGALPSHEANTNPFGYKFSWSPRGVLLASRNAAKWLEDDEIQSVPGEALFEHYTMQDVPDVGTFENYPNRDSLPYKKLYGLHDATTVYRGTFRLTGWCETMKAIASLGWLSDESLNDFNGSTYGEVTQHLLGMQYTKDLDLKVSEYLGLKTYSAVIHRLRWLGLFSDTPLPSDKDTPLDYLNVLTLEKMSLPADERDMIVMHHEFIAMYDDKQDYITSTLVDYGIPNGDTSIARTVALPAAIAVKMILEKDITITGVHIPVLPEIYNPILDELEQLGITFQEKIQPAVLE